ncbi:hypothetical protein FN846DRAFT_954429 [Sphaerosporella brunnea]|uniref:Uncharacterized protein n=1 Tax=Sphaerosporella brunnea TaxID=1250544 RepID=A0A5J5EU58_9PEZI|nr:hypothetical protein FN846DRAFT_954429 [Sphaerosporella brunnea]
MPPRLAGKKKATIPPGNRKLLPPPPPPTPSIGHKKETTTDAQPPRLTKVANTKKQEKTATVVDEKLLSKEQSSKGKKNALASKSTNFTPHARQPSRNVNPGMDQENILHHGHIPEQNTSRRATRASLGRALVIPNGDEDAVVTRIPGKPSTTSPTAAWLKDKACGVVSGAKRAANVLLKSPSRQHGKKYYPLPEEPAALIQGKFKSSDFILEMEKLEQPGFPKVTLEGEDVDELSLPNGGYSVSYEDKKTVVQHAPYKLVTIPEEGLDMESPLAQSTPKPGWLRRKKAFRSLKEMGTSTDYSLPEYSASSEGPEGPEWAVDVNKARGGRSKRIKRTEAPLTGKELKKKKASPDLRAATNRITGKRSIKASTKASVHDLEAEDPKFDLGDA